MEIIDMSHLNFMSSLRDCVTQDIPLHLRKQKHGATPPWPLERLLTSLLKYQCPYLLTLLLLALNELSLCNIHYLGVVWLIYRFYVSGYMFPPGEGFIAQLAKGVVT